MDGKKTVPMRMCIVCREMIEKKNLIRIVRYGDCFSIDTTFRANGRGAYVCKNNECMEKCIKKKILNKAFKAQVSDEIYTKLAEEYDALKNS